MKNAAMYIVAIILIIAFGLLFDYIENGTNYAVLFKSTNHRVPAAVQVQPTPTPANK